MSRCRAAVAATFMLLAVSGVARSQTADTPAADGQGTSSASRSWWRSALGSSRELVGQLNDNRFLPQLKSFSDNTGPAPGLVYWKPRLGRTDISLYGSYAHSFRGDELRELRFGRIPSNGRRPPRRGDYE